MRFIECREHWLLKSGRLHLSCYFLTKNPVHSPRFLRSIAKSLAGESTAASVPSANDSPARREARVVRVRIGSTANERPKLFRIEGLHGFRSDIAGCRQLGEALENLRLAVRTEDDHAIVSANGPVLRFDPDAGARGGFGGRFGVQRRLWGIHLIV